MRFSVGLRRFLVVTLGSASAAFAGRAAKAQVVVHGTITEAATQEPVSGATTIIRDVRDSVVGSAVTNAQGQFFIRFTEHDTATYSVAARRMGYDAREAGGLLIHPADTLAVSIKLPRLAVVLDTVRTTAAPEQKKFLGITWGVTPGRELFAEHLREGKGYFFSGQEILWSKLGACDYFAEVPGLTVNTFRVGVPCGRAQTASRWISSATQPNCLHGYVDRIGALAELDDEDNLRVTLKSATTGRGGRGGRGGGPKTEPLDIPVEDVMGVEVYKNRSEIPSEMIRDLDIPITQNCAYVRIWTNQAW